MLVLVNMALMCMPYYGMSEEYEASDRAESQAPCRRRGASETRSGPACPTESVRVPPFPKCPSELSLVPPSGGHPAAGGP